MEQAISAEAAINKTGKNSKAKKRVYWLTFVVLLILQIAMIVYFGFQKSGYSLDELTSYGLSNSYYQAQIYSGDALKNWVDGDYFSSYIEIGSDETMTLGSVVANQKNDLYTPMFYFGLNIASSLFPNSFSKWFGIIPNIIYFAAAQFTLLLISRKLFGKDKFASLLPMAVFGFTVGAISYVLYIRMYMMVTMWLLVLINFHVKGMVKGKLSIMDLFAIATVTFLGFMTHYYFIIFAFFMAAFYFFWLIVKKKGIGAVLSYCASMLCGLGLVFGFYPYAYEKFLADRNIVSADNVPFELSDWGSVIKTFFDELNTDVFSSYALWAAPALVLLAVVALVFFLVKRKKGEKSENVGSFSPIVMLAVASVLYFLTVTVIAPRKSGSYISIIYPVIILAVTYIAYKLLCSLKIHQWVSLAAVAAVGISVSACGVYSGDVRYLYTELKDNESIAEEYEGSDCLYFSDDWSLLAANALELRHMGRVRALGLGELHYSVVVTNSKKTDHIIVYVESLEDISYNEQAVEDFADFDSTDDFIEAVKEVTGYENSEHLYTSRSEAYLLYN